MGMLVAVCSKKVGTFLRWRVSSIAEPSLMSVGSEKAVPQRPRPKATPETIH
jgi:hypothetical protein